MLSIFQKFDLSRRFLREVASRECHSTINPFFLIEKCMRLWRGRIDLSLFSSPEWVWWEDVPSRTRRIVSLKEAGREIGVRFCKCICGTTIDGDGEGNVGALDMLLLQDGVDLTRDWKFGRGADLWVCAMVFFAISAFVLLILRHPSISQCLTRLKFGDPNHVY